MTKSVFTRAARPLLVAPLLALGLLVVGVEGGHAMSAQAQCEGMVDGRVAWNRNGATNWSMKGVRNLCRGSSDPYQTIACFNAGIRRHGDWRRAIPDCTPRGESRNQPRQAPRRAPPKKSIYEMTAHDFLYGGARAPTPEIRSGGYGLPVPR